MFYNDTKQRLEELCHDNEELKELLHTYNKEMTVLLSQISHEIKNPLTLMYSTLQLIESKNPDVKQISYWPTLSEDMKDIFSLLENISDFARSDTITKTETNLYSLLSDLVLTFQPLADEKDLVLAVFPPKNDPDSRFHSYYCDTIKLKQVYTNLIKNAIESARLHSTVCVELTLEKQKEKALLCISVTNTGPMIAKEDLDSIFVPFTTTKETGSGLGLPTCKQILHAHGGEITVASSEHTTTFATYLPLNS